MKRFLPLMALLLYASLCHAQPFTIKGNVTDTLNDNKLQFASVTLIRAADSIMENYTRSKQDGNFELQTNKPGKYLIMITFPSFADYIDILTLDKNKTVDLGIVPMISKAHLLSEFVLKQQIGAIKIKGDTTEYVADSFKVRENATVEELLKKLPGIQVDKDGKVTAQGETVQKILVDGEEFFTDDPAVVTKSLQAKAVDKVQVFDKKSDNATFTGIDDGSREKTINLQLKDNYKKGYFGKLKAGGGTDGFFENQGMLNAFKAKRKFSAFGIMANTGTIGLGWQDRDKFGGGDGVNREMTEDGMMMTYYQGDDEDGGGSGSQYNGEGLPTAWTGGLHYSNKWQEDKQHLSSNYRYSKNNLDKVSNSITEQNLQDFKQYTVESSNSFRSGERHRLDGLYEWKPDTNSQLKITANGGYTKNISSTAYSSDTRFGDSLHLNDNSRNSTNDATGKSLNASLNYRRKFSKKGRNMSLNMDESYRANEGTGFFNSTTRYFDLASPGAIDSTRLINQRKINNTENFRINAKLSYTEPLSKKIFLELNYGAGINNSSAEKKSFEKKGVDSGYDSLNTINSSDYDFNVFTNTGGANLRFVLKAINFSFGGSVSNAQFSQKDKLPDAFDYSFDRNYTNFFPRASFSYRQPGKQKSVSVNYSGSTRQPSIDQIQPFQQNTDPLNIAIGNPNLRQEFNHYIGMNYNDYQVLKQTYTYMGGGFNFTNDDIGRSENYSAGKRTYKYINVDGNYNGWFYGGYGFNIKKLDLRMAVRGNANVARYLNYVNGLKNESKNNSYSFSLDFNHDKEKKYNIYYSPSVTYNSNRSSINATATNYFSFENEWNGNVELPLKFEIGTSINWMVRQQVAAFDKNNDVFRWNAYVAKKFLKGDVLELRASVFDILNQNIGFDRYGNGNSVVENNYNTIRRYGLLSLVWNFTKSASGAPKEEDGMKIIIKN